MNRMIALVTALMVSLAVGASAQVRVKPGAGAGKVGPGGATGKLVSKGPAPGGKTGPMTTSGTPSGKPTQAKPGSHGEGTGDGVAKGPASSGK